jgi:hypothetical protein
MVAGVVGEGSMLSGVCATVLLSGSLNDAAAGAVAA